MQTDLKALQERVEAAAGPDRELDHALLMISPAGAFLRDNGYVRVGDLYISENPPIKGANKCSGPQHYTASLDAALALVEEILPQRNSEILREAISAESKRHNRHMCFAPLNVSELARDVIAALLRALQSESAKVNEDQKR